MQFLILGVADGKNQAAALAQLGEKRWRHGLCGSCDQDGVKRRALRQTERAIPAVDMNVEVSQARKPLGCRRGQRASAFHGVNLFRKERQNSCLIAATSPNFKNALAAREI